MQLHAITSRLSDERGQAAVEFALVLPLLIAFLFLIAGFGRLFNAYNDVNQIAADAARFAAVGVYPDQSVLLEAADTKLSKTAIVVRKYVDPVTEVELLNCAVGAMIRVTVTMDVKLLPFVGFINETLDGVPTLVGKAEMRVERCP